MSDIDKYIKEFENINSSFSDLLNNKLTDKFVKDLYDQLGWKLFDLIASIDIKKCKDFAERIKLRNMLEQSKVLANNLKLFKSYIDSVADLKLSDLLDTKDDINKEEKDEPKVLSFEKFKTDTMSNVA